MKTLYISYCNNSSTTGRALFETLKARNLEGVSVRRCNGKQPAKRPDVLIRWGAATVDTPAGAVELNSREAVRRASVKREMMETLSQDPNVPTPVVHFDTANGYEGFCRNADNVVEFRRSRRGDKYVTERVDRQREFRVHVFNGKTVGVYEKVPQNANELILKDHNSDFRRLDQANKALMRPINGVRPAAVAAVNALGLLFGGVDVLLDRNGNAFVTEVNSAPGLNEPNLDRFTDLFLDYIQLQNNANAPQQQA